MMLRRIPVKASSTAGAGATRTATSPRRRACSAALASQPTPFLDLGSLIGPFPVTLPKMRTLKISRPQNLQSFWGEP
ncbi:hypothetical protein LEMLEM_LOCUS19131 [Lemmus lemmus]